MNAPHPSPDLIFETLTAYQRSDALKAAIELDLFTAVDEGARDVAALSAKLSAPERGVRILCDFLVIGGFLAKKDGRYALTPDTAAFLSRKSPACLGSISAFLTAPALREGFADLASVVRSGKPSSSGGLGTLAPEHPVWIQFARSMAPMMAMPAQMIAEALADEPVRKALDISAGHGLFGIAVAKRHPKAEVTGLDWAPVLQVARENAAAAGVQARYKTIAGSAFEAPLGEDYDLVLIPNFLHHFDAATNEKLLAKAHRALRPGGRVAILEFVPNEDRVSPPIPAAFSLVMLGSTPSGDAFTYKELAGMLSRAGFKRSEARALTPSPQTLIVARKD